MEFSQKIVVDCLMRTLTLIQGFSQGSQCETHPDVEQESSHGLRHCELPEALKPYLRVQVPKNHILT